MNKIKHYGWVPFPYFQHVFLVLLIFSLYNWEKINKNLDKKIYKPIQNKFKNETITLSTKISVSLIPIIIILYLDIRYSSFSMNNLRITKYVPDHLIDTILKLFGGYCIVQVAAQDVGFKTGIIQSNFVKLPLLQFLMYSGIAFSLTQNRSMSIIATLTYFQLKFFGSLGKTRDVCFEK